MTSTEIILSSSLIATIVSVILNYIVTYWQKQMDYKNEYYKEIIKKRLEAYEYAEKVIAMLKTTSMDLADGRPYHVLMDCAESIKLEFYRNLMSAMNYSLWINDETVECLTKVNLIFFQVQRVENKKSGIVIGKEYYNEISIARKHLEISVKNDLLNLHNIKHFRKDTDFNAMNTIPD